MKLSFKIKFAFIMFMFGLLFSSQANAATLELALGQNIVSTKEDISVLVSINSEDQDINTAQATIIFPANLLEVVKIDQVSSIFSFWLEQPSYDNAKGTIRFVGGSTSGFTGSSLKVMNIAFKVKGSGNGRLSITDGAITASDGTGSNVYNTAKGLDINIPATADFQAVKVEQAKREAILTKDLPIQYGLNIPFYPDSTKWNNRSASFQVGWKIGSDTTQAGVIINKNPIFSPVASAEALTGNKVFPALADGVYYLHLRLGNGGGWNPTLHYRIAVDTTPPSSFKITSKDGMKTIQSKPNIDFTATDLTSGINNYIIRLDGATVDTVTKPNYTFQPLLPGIHQLTVVAVDNAGNSTSQTQALEILPIISPLITYVNRTAIVNEGGITAGGTASEGIEVITQIQNSQKQIVAEQIVPIDSNGNWNVTLNKGLVKGNYNLLATTRDKNMSSSFPAVSENIKVTPKPVLVLGSLQITEAWFFIILIIILLCSFGGGLFTYYKWRGQLGRRVTIAQRDVINVLDNLKKNVDKLLKIYKDGGPSEGDISEMEYTLKEMKENVEKSRHYVVDNIREISD
jgi:hypothetical protein